jgi:hypothetical protein
VPKVQARFLHPHWRPVPEVQPVPRLPRLRVRGRLAIAADAELDEQVRLRPLREEGVPVRLTHKQAREWGIVPPPARGRKGKQAVDLAPLFKAHGLPGPEREYRFAPPRRWRFDYCFPSEKLAVEIEGGVWIQGRHTRGSGFVRDLAKYNRAAILGWRLVRVTPRQVETGEVFVIVRAALGQAAGRLRSSEHEV